MASSTERIMRNGARHAPLAILPGLMCDGRMFGGQTSQFPDAVVVGNFYGGVRRIEAMARYALDRLPEHFSLMGHSMGARVALEIYRLAPERVSRLALVDTGIHPVKDGEAQKRFSLRDHGRAHGMAALVDRWLPPMLGDAGLANPTLVENLHAMSASAGIAIYEAQIDALLHRPVVNDLLGTISCPTIVVVGEQDRWSPPEQHRAIANAIPGAQLHIVKDAGHMLPAEQPSRFNAILAEWL